MKALHIAPIIESNEVSEQLDLLLEYVGEARMSGDRQNDETLIEFVNDLPEPMRSETRKLLKLKDFWSIDPEVGIGYAESGAWEGDIHFVSAKLTTAFEKQISDYFKAIGASVVTCTWTDYPDDWTP